MNQLFSRVRHPLLVLAVGLACLFVHELGHVVAAYGAGQRVTSFVVLSLHPHVSTAGPTTAAADAITAASGSGLMLLFWLVILLLPGSPARRLFCETISTFAFIEILGWTLSSLWPQTTSDDTARFLRLTGANPLLVVSALLLLATAGAALLMRLRSPGTGQLR